jgi:hypothetical protein
VSSDGLNHTSNLMRGHHSVLPPLPQKSVANRRPQNQTHQTHQKSIKPVVWLPEEVMMAGWLWVLEEVRWGKSVPVLWNLLHVMLHWSHMSLVSHVMCTALFR